MRLVLLALATVCRSAPPPPPVASGPTRDAAPQAAPAAPCTMPADADLFELLRAHDCIVAPPAAGVADVAPADLDVRLVRGGREYYDSVSFLVLFENRGAKPIALDLALHDQRLCFELRGGPIPSHACELLTTAPAGIDSRARVILQPHVTARVEGLVFIRHGHTERSMPNGANGWFDEPLPPGNYDAVVTVPLAGGASLLRTTVAVP